VPTREKLERIGAERVSADDARHRCARDALGGVEEIKLHGPEFPDLDRFGKPAFAFAERRATAMAISTSPRYMVGAIVFGAAVALVHGLVMTGGGRWTRSSRRSAFAPWQARGRFQPCSRSVRALPNCGSTVRP
jgi:hypothetical protein